MAENTKDDIVEMSRWRLSVLKTKNFECINLDNQVWINLQCKSVLRFDQCLKYFTYTV